MTMSAFPSAVDAATAAADTAAECIDCWLLLLPAGVAAAAPAVAVAAAASQAEVSDILDAEFKFLSALTCIWGIGD